MQRTTAQRNAAQAHVDSFTMDGLNSSANLMFQEGGPHGGSGTGLAIPKFMLRTARPSALPRSCPWAALQPSKGVPRPASLPTGASYLQSAAAKASSPGRQIRYLSGNIWLKLFRCRSDSRSLIASARRVFIFHLRCGCFLFDQIMKSGKPTSPCIQRPGTTSFQPREERHRA